MTKAEHETETEGHSAVRRVTTGRDKADALPVLVEQRAVIYQPRHRPLWNNTITILGLVVTAMGLLLLVTFGLFSLISPSHNPYVDIVGYLILPSILIIGLVLVPLGILFKSWRLRRRDPEQHLTFRLPRIDLNDPAQRRVLKYVMIGMFVLIPVVGVSAYHGYHYTDSTQFCSKACHTPMKPQATTYEYSAHARVSCAECHIGSGASWFVKSKLSGTRQVVAMWRDSFSRPIPPAIHHLRPARETCEHCHWPKKFFGAQLKELVHFASDEDNTRRDVNMLIKTGGGDESTGRAEGIHMHMALEGRIEYLATDDRLQNIPWVRWIDDAGNELIYRSDGRPSSDPRPDGQLRHLDCMDCHNRPAHKFRSPQESVNLFLNAGRIDTTLPFIKREATRILVEPYPDTETAEAQIGDQLLEFYRENYPKVWSARRASVNQAVDAVREIYRQSFFPAMKVDWRTYPDNIGHLYSPGCFRCHDGTHVNQNGERLSHACDVCHTFLNPSKGGDDGSTFVQGQFQHPFELEGPHRTMRCSSCHTGGLAPDPTCSGCHTTQTQFRNGELAAFEPFEIPAEPMADFLSCDGCHDLAEPTTVRAIDNMCMACHEDSEDEKFDGLLASWKNEADKLIAEAEERADEEGLELLRLLKRAGPLHNMEATRKITRAISAGVQPPAKPDQTASVGP